MRRRKGSVENSRSDILELEAQGMIRRFLVEADLSKSGAKREMQAARRRT
jgi:hypothetical protein